MFRWTVLVLALSCMIAGCSKRQKAGGRERVRTSNSKGSAKPARVGSAANPKGGSKSGGPHLWRHAKKDGDALSKLLVGAAGLSPYSMAESKLLNKKEQQQDAAKIKQVLAALNPEQRVKAGWKPCGFTHGLVLRDKRGKNFVAIGVCDPGKGAVTTRASVIDLKGKVEWGVTVPNAAALTRLLDKHLVGSRLATRGASPRPANTPVVQPKAKAAPKVKVEPLTKAQPKAKAAPKAKVQPRAKVQLKAK